MTDLEWSKVKSLLQEVSELDPLAREEVLRQRASTGQAAIVAEVRELLGAGDSLGDSSFLEPPSLEAFTEAVVSIQPGTKYADFEVIEEIGRGGAGVVYRAHQASLGRDVALKLLMPRPSEAERETRRFIREARSAASLQHPGIVSVHAVGVEEGVAYLAMELASGGTLADSLQGRPVGWEQALEWAIEVASAMQVAHQSGIVHRDLKPSNLLKTTDGRIVIADFGLARGLEGDLETTFAGAVGTPRYMAPDLLKMQSSDSVDPRCDVYSLGVVLFELLAGHAPFQAESLHELFDQIRSRDPFLDPAVLAGVPTELQAICAKAMEKDPNRRYSTMSDFLADMQRLLAGQPVHAKFQPIWLRRVRSYSQAAWVASALIGLVLLVGSLLLWEWSKSAPIGEDETRFVWSGSDEVRLTLSLASALGEPGWTKYTEQATLDEASNRDLRLARGLYRVVAWRGDEFAEWDLWPQAEVQLDEQGLVFVAAGQAVANDMFRVPQGTMEQFADVEVPAFDLDRRLVSNGSFALFLAWSAAHVSPEQWQRLEPIYWQPQLSLNWWFSPVLGVQPSAARDFARWRGKRLPTALELSRANEFLESDFSAERLQEAWRQKWSHWLADWQLVPTTELGYAAAQRGIREFAMFLKSFGAERGVFTGLREWTSSLDIGGSGDRVLFGAAWHDPPHLHATATRQLSPFLPLEFEVSAMNIGFRCARTVHPALAP